MTSAKIYCNNECIFSIESVCDHNHADYASPIEIPNQEEAKKILGINQRSSDPLDSLADDQNEIARLLNTIEKVQQESNTKLTELVMQSEQIKPLKVGSESNSACELNKQKESFMIDSDHED